MLEDLGRPPVMGFWVESDPDEVRVMRPRREPPAPARRDGLVPRRYIPRAAAAFVSATPRAAGAPVATSAPSAFVGLNAFLDLD